MSGGGGSDNSGPQPTFKPVEQTDLQTGGWGGMGYTPVPQTFTPQGQPDWMQGHFAAPWWGQNAATGQALSQQQLQPQGMPQPPVGAPQAPQQMGSPGKGPGTLEARPDPMAGMYDEGAISPIYNNLQHRRALAGLPSLAGGTRGNGTQQRRLW